MNDAATIREVRLFMMSGRTIVLMPPEGGTLCRFEEDGTGTWVALREDGSIVEEVYFPEANVEATGVIYEEEEQ